MVSRDKDRRSRSGVSEALSVDASKDEKSQEIVEEMRDHRHDELVIGQAEDRDKEQPLPDGPDGEWPQIVPNVMQQPEEDRQREENRQLDTESSEEEFLADAGHECARDDCQEALPAKHLGQSAMASSVAVAEEEQEGAVDEQIAQEDGGDSEEPIKEIVEG